MPTKEATATATAEDTTGDLLAGSAALASAVLLAGAQPALAQPQAAFHPRAPTPAPGATANNPTETLASVMWDLVAANRILAQQNVMDGEGHVSARNPINPDTYLIGTAGPPQLVTLDKIVEMDFDSRPMDTKGRGLYGERFIHGAIYRARPDVQAIVHFHDPMCVLMGDSEEPLRPQYHMSGFIGLGIPVFEIRDFAGDATHLTITNLMRAHNLAQVLGNHPGVLMRGHGATVTGNSLLEATSRAIYLAINCELQSRVLGRQVELKYLSPGETRMTTHMMGETKCWEIWKGIAMSDYRPDSGKYG